MTENIPPIMRQLFDKLVDEMIDASERGVDYNLMTSQTMHQFVFAGACRNLDPMSLVKMVTEQGARKVELYCLGKNAKHFYEMPLPPTSGMVAFALANPFRGLETAVFTRQEDRFTIKKAYFENVNIVENDQNKTAQIIAQSPRIEEVYTGSWDGNYRSLVKRVEPYYDKQTCLLSLVSSGTSELTQTAYLTGTLAQILAAEKKKEMEERDGSK
jgi:hypothetical protein